MTSCTNRIAGLLGLAIVIQSPTAARDTNPEKAEEKSFEFYKDIGGNQDVFAYDFGVPASPAMHLLGLQGGSLAPSSTLKSFVQQVSNAISGAGQSFALEITPAALANGGKNLQRYMRDGSEGYWYRLARRLHFGAAGVLGNAGDKPIMSGVSLGLTVAMLDSSDPLRASFTGYTDGFKACLLQQSQKIIPIFEQTTNSGLVYKDDKPLYDSLGVIEDRIGDTLYNIKQLGALIPTGLIISETETVVLSLAGIVVPATLAGEPVKGLEELNRSIGAKRKTLVDKKGDAYLQIPAVQSAQREIMDCAKRASNAAAYGTDLTIGGGTFWRGKPGEFAELKNGGGAVWAALRTSFHTEWEDDAKTKPSAAWLVGVSSRYGIRETIATGDTTVANIRADTLDGWAGIERRSPDFLASARIGYQQVRANEAVGRFFNQQGTRFLFNAQQRVTDQMWLSLSYGNAGGSVDTLNAKRFLVSVAFSPPKPDNIVGSKN